MAGGRIHRQGMIMVDYCVTCALILLGLFTDRFHSMLFIWESGLIGAVAVSWEPRSLCPGQKATTS